VVQYAIIFLWKGNLAAPNLVGQAEAVVANVSSYRDGILAELTATRFQKVKAGRQSPKSSFPIPEFTSPPWLKSAPRLSGSVAIYALP
jgi:hypothetical protein